ncbi:MAG: adenylylsulfate reductase subunit alpha, partial [bacterium]|nr:adenylylsulfate reductase subunit alpha [bacterium]
RIAGKAMCSFVVDNPGDVTIDMAKVEELKAKLLKPLDIFAEHSGKTTDPNINPEYIRPKMFMFRLQKIMDEYVGGVTAQFSTNESQLNRALELLDFLREDAEKLAAEDLHELMRCWENVQRMWQAEAHVRTVLFREETRWPGYYFRADFPTIKEDWKVFANCIFHPDSNEWEMVKRDIKELT